jgi:hypothetical protein
MSKPQNLVNCTEGVLADYGCNATSTIVVHHYYLASKLCSRWCQTGRSKGYLNRTCTHSIDHYYEA